MHHPTTGHAPRVATRGPDPVTVALWIAGALVTLLLPWFVPLRHRLVSSSYNVGFDNQVAMLGAATTALLLGIHGLRQRLGKDRNSGLPLTELVPSQTDCDGFGPATSPHPSPLPAKGEGTGPASISNHNQADALPGVQADRSAMLALAPWALLLALAYCVVLGAWYLWIPNNTAFEMGNALARIELLLLRQVPYRDFQFNYGPLFLYLPAAIVTVSHHGVGAGTAYFYSLLIFACLGLALLFYIVAAFALPRHTAIGIFVLMALAGFNFLLGMNYTLLRFALPYAGLVALHHEANRYAGKPNSAARLRLFVLNLVLTLAAFAVSPETGIAQCIGCVGYYFARFRTLRNAPGTSVGALLGAAFLLWREPGYLGSILAYGGGADMLQVVPSEHILFYLGCLFWTIPTLVAKGWQQRDAGGALLLAWAAVVLVFVAPALGRCDPIHIYFNGFGLFLIDLILLANSPRAFKNYGVLFGVLFIVVSQVGFFWHFSDEIASIRDARRQGQTRFDRNFLGIDLGPDSGRDRALASMLRLSIAPAQAVGIPFGVDEEVETTLKRYGLYAPEHHPAPSIDVFNDAALAVKIADTLRCKWLLVPIDALTAPPPNPAAYAANLQQLLSRLFVFPMPYPLRNPPFFTSTALTAAIRTNYRPVRQIGTYWLAERR